MKRNITLIYLYSILLLLVFILITVLSLKNIPIFNKENSIIIILLISIIFLISSFGIKADKNYLKGTTIRTVITFLMCYTILIYSLGLILGFNVSYFNLNIKTEFLNILPILLIVIGTEIIKKIIFSKTFGNTKIVILISILMSALLVLYELNINTLQTSEEKFIFICTIVLPIISQEFLCSYITYKVSWIPSLIFKLFINLYIYIIPIVPNLGDYLYSVLNILLAFSLYFSLSKIIMKYEKVKSNLLKYNNYLFIMPIIIFLIVVIILASGIFKYKLVAIASNSMKPTFSRGDGVIYEKINTDDLKKGDIVAIKKENIVVIHRIVKIWKKGNDNYYVTKGDNNNDVDIFKPTEKDILGRIKYYYKYIGYPTVLINELFRKE